MGDVRKLLRQAPKKTARKVCSTAPGTLERILWEERLCEELEQATDDGLPAPPPERLPPPPHERD